MIKKIDRYIQTIRYLKTRQIFYLLFYRLYKPKIKFDNEIITPITKIKINFHKNNYNPFENITKNIIKFHNKNYVVNKDLCIKEDDKLWFYHLHYFDYLNSKKINSILKKKIIDKWLRAQNRVFDNRFDAYPLSLRLVNFIKFAYTNSFYERSYLKSIYNQFIYLNKILEFHIQGNHLLTNIKALIFCGIFFNDKYSKKILNSSLILLKREIFSQFDNKFIHKEGSTLYCTILLEDLLDIYYLIKHANIKNQYYIFLKDIIPKIYETNSFFYFSDFRINKFNDSFLRDDITPYKIISNTILNEFNIKPYNKNFSLNNGWIIVKDFDYKIIINGFDNFLQYQPGHIHASLLSFELEIKNEKIFSNKGVSTYNDNLIRKLERSSRAYNTLQINTENIHDVWKSFRVGRRSKIIDRKFKKYNNKYYISLAHDGYKKSFNVTHKRIFILEKRKITIIDKIDRKINAKICSRFYTDKKFNIKKINNKSLLLKSRLNNLHIKSNSDTNFRNTYVSNGINNTFESNLITMNIEKNISKTIIKW